MNKNLLDSVRDIDLTAIKNILYIKGWSYEDCEKVEYEYKCFLALSREYPNESLAPSKAVDTFWHYHILDTRKYAQDCQQFLGRFIHHIPLPEATPQEREQARQAGETTLRLYREHFGEPSDLWTSERTCMVGGCQNNPPR